MVDVIPFSLELDDRGVNGKSMIGRGADESSISPWAFDALCIGVCHLLGLHTRLGLILGMILYMVIILYGQMVLTSVVEEKASRVVDVLVPHLLRLGLG